LTENLLLFSPLFKVDLDLRGYAYGLVMPEEVSVILYLTLTQELNVYFVFLWCLSDAGGLLGTALNLETVIAILMVAISSTLWCVGVMVAGGLPSKMALLI